ncbi:MAG TPA: hypothetical protein DIT25_01005 [Candidatus Moranbacteria bacterium]|nr:hypothetical protein [Candidatus Moranbacteria bacterium]
MLTTHPIDWNFFELNGKDFHLHDLDYHTLTSVHEFITGFMQDYHWNNWEERKKQEDERKMEDEKNIDNLKKKGILK